MKDIYDEVNKKWYILALLPARIAILVHGHERRVHLVLCQMECYENNGNGIINIDIGPTSSDQLSSKPFCVELFIV